MRERANAPGAVAGGLPILREGLPAAPSAQAAGRALLSTTDLWAGAGLSSFQKNRLRAVAVTRRPGRETIDGEDTGRSGRLPGGRPRGSPCLGATREADATNRLSAIMGCGPAQVEVAAGHRRNKNINES
jgi:hypothetical protein